MEAFRLSAETLDGDRETAVDVVDWDGVRRDLAIVLGYCCDEGEELLGG